MMTDNAAGLIGVADGVSTVSTRGRNTAIGNKMTTP